MSADEYTQLEAAEQELYEWATGERSCISEMLNIEGNREDRTKTLALVEARDADAIRAAREKVLALRLLASGVLGVNAATIRAERVAPDDAIVEVMDYVASKAIGDLAAELVRTRAERDEARATIRAERVAPDRETLARASWDWWWRFDDSGIKDRRWDDPDYAAMRALHEAFADFLLASGVFKVRSSTAPDRETLARALCEIDMRGKDRSIEEVLTPGIALWVRYLPEADALLASDALGVNADTIRADALDAIAGRYAVQFFWDPMTNTESSAPIPGVTAWLRARAAEYRKAAGA